MLIKHCLQTMSNSLYSQGLLSEEVYETVGNTSLGQTARAKAILDCLEGIFQLKPASFTTVIHIMKSEPYLSSLADQLEQYYRGKRFLRVNS